MKDFFQSRLIPVIALCSLSVPSMALVGGGLDSQVAPISRQVEQRASRAAERAMDRRLEEQVKAQAADVAQVRERLENLPATIHVLTESGQEAFNDVVLDTGFRAVQSQWLVMGTDPEIAHLDQPGITIVERNELPGLGMTVVRFNVTAGLDSRAALEAALPELADRLDRNHIYAPQTGANPAPREFRKPSWQSLCEAPVRVGMVDTAIDRTHPAFANANIVQKRFLEMKEVDAPLAEIRDHGTAVASLMVGNHKDQWPARLPKASLFNASVFYGRDQHLSGATLGHLLSGLNWLAGQQLSVINISLAGPDNRLLAAAVKALREQGLLMVAAVGNEGPSAPPLYPAAYPGVVGVTAVDASGGLYRWANRGEQVMFASPGVAVPVAQPDGGLAADSGTSLAAPVITAALACQRHGSTEEEAIDALIKEAKDLGKPGRDASFGHGLVNW